MDAFLGIKYTLVSSENLEEYLEFLEMGYLSRKIAKTLKPNQRLILNEDGTYNLELLSAVTNSVTKFTPGVEFDEVKPDGSKAKSTFTLDGNKLIQIQVEQPSGKTSKHIREFFPDKLIVTTTAIGFDKTVKRIYELIK